MPAIMPLAAESPPAITFSMRACCRSSSYLATRCITARKGGADLAHLSETLYCGNRVRTVAFDTFFYPGLKGFPVELLCGCRLDGSYRGFSVQNAEEGVGKKSRTVGNQYVIVGHGGLDSGGI